MVEFRASGAVVAQWQHWRDARAETGQWSWGRQWLDRHLGPPSPGDLVVLGARPNVGKSFLSLDMLNGVASTGALGLYLSLEDPPHRVGRRLGCGLGAERLLCAWLPSNTSSFAVEAIEQAGKAGVSVVVLDYAQCLAYSGDVQVWSEAAARGRVVDEVKAALVRAGVCGVLLSQIKRPPPGDFGGQPPFPRMFDLKETSRLEDAAESILLMGPTRDRKGVHLELAKAKDSEVGKRVTLRRDQTNGRLLWAAATPEAEQEAASDEAEF